MKRGVVIALCGVAIAAVAGCAHSRPSTPDVRALPPSQLERQWLGRWHLQPSSAHVKTPSSLGDAIAKARKDGGLQVVSVSTYNTPTLAPAITLAVSEPASFLKHRLDPIVLATRPYNAAYIRIVDVNGRRILEWYKTGSGGALRVRSGLQGCSPITTFGLGGVPPCPAR